MFGTIVVTFIVTILSMTTLFLCCDRRDKERESVRLRRANDMLNRQMNDHMRSEQERREKSAYNRGLYDGRETDALYRSMLSQYEKGERATVMMYGNGRTEGKHG